MDGINAELFAIIEDFVALGLKLQALRDAKPTGVDLRSLSIAITELEGASLWAANANQ